MATQQSTGGDKGDAAQTGDRSMPEATRGPCAHSAPRGSLAGMGRAASPSAGVGRTIPPQGTSPWQHGWILLRQKAQRPVVLMTYWLSVCLSFHRLKASALLKFPLGQSSAAPCGKGFCSSAVPQEGHNCRSKPNFPIRRQIVMGHSFDLLKHFFPQTVGNYPPGTNDSPSLKHWTFATRKLFVKDTDSHSFWSIANGKKINWLQTVYLRARFVLGGRCKENAGSCWCTALHRTVNGSEDPTLQSSRLTPPSASWSCC